MRNFIAIFVTLTFLSSLELLADVLEPKTRSDRIQGGMVVAEKFNQAVEPDINAYSEVRYPFALPPRAPVVVEVTDSGAPPPPPPPASAQILDSFADRFQRRIAGVIQRGGGFLLILRDGPYLQAGQPIRYPYRGDSYVIVVESVSDETYTLRLDELTKTLKIDPEAGRGVRRDESPPEINDEPSPQPR